MEAAKSARKAAAVLRAEEAQIDDELIRACWDAEDAWAKLAVKLSKKRASTLPQDGRSEVPVDDPTSEPSDDFPEIPACLDRRHA